MTDRVERMNAKRWWKMYRGARGVRTFFLRDIPQGLRNLALFFPVVWRWRWWDFSYDYDLFMRAIELHRKALLRQHMHVHWRRDAHSMDLTLLRWQAFKDSEDWDEEMKVWDLMHDHLKRNARGWWD